MARGSKKLTARTVATTTAPGRHADGGNLYLNVTESGARSWLFMWKVAGKRREMGLGSARDVSLQAARIAAADCRKRVLAGGDPIADKARINGVPTFGEVADELLASISEGFRNKKHRAQWVSTLATYAAPLRELKVNAIDTSHVLTVLKPIWTAKPETASRVRGRIEKVLDAARAKGHRHGENPARWRGHLDHLLPRRAALSRGHHAAMRYTDLPAFLKSLRGREAIAALALEFTILTAARSGETLGARWDEIDLPGKVWTIPAARMKAAKEHRVPLSDRACAIVAKVAETRSGEFVFPGQKTGRALSTMSMEMLLRRMKVEDVTVHGFRSAFRDWAGNETLFARELAETALAHVTGDRTEQAYRRGDALEKRRALMEAWAQWCGTVPADNVVRLRA